MAIRSKELKYYFCQDHIDQYEQNIRRNHPGYKFNTYVSFSGKSCAISNCKELTFYECIGIQIPDAIGNMESPRVSKPVQEIFTSAKQLLDGGPSLERLTVFLKTKIIPQYKSLVCDNIVKHHAKLILEKLRIDAECSLSDIDKDRILRELKMYPADWE